MVLLFLFCLFLFSSSLWFVPFIFVEFNVIFIGIQKGVKANT